MNSRGVKDIVGLYRMEAIDERTMNIWASVHLVDFFFVLLLTAFVSILVSLYMRPPHDLSFLLTESM